MNRLTPAAPMASPIANDNPTVTVLLIAFLPYARPGEAVREHYLFFRGRSRLQLHCILEDCLFELLRGGPHQCASTPFIGAKTAHGKYSNSLLFSRSSGIRGSAREGFRPCGEIPDSTAFAPLALPSPHTGCHEIQPMARASRRRVPRSKGNPACGSSARASRRHSRECRWQSERGRRGAIRAQASQSCDLARTAGSNAAASAMDRGRADPPG